MRHLLDVRATAEYLGTSTRHIYELVATRQIAHTKVGRYLRFAEEDLDDYLLANRTPARRPTGTDFDLGRGGRA